MAINNGNHGEKPPIAVVVVPLPAQGHLNQLLHLSRRLASASAAAGNLSVHYVAGAAHIRQAKLRALGTNPNPSPVPNIDFHELPVPPFNNPEPDPHAPTKFPSQLIPSFHAALDLRAPILAFVTELSARHKRVVVIYDSLMTYVVQDVDSVPNVESYCFWSVSAFCLQFSRWDADGRPDLPENEKETEILFRDLPGLDNLFPPEFALFRKMQRSSRKTFSGDIYNSSRVIEGPYLEYLAIGVEKQWAVGPFNPVGIVHNPQSRIKNECLDWLDQQSPDSSIIFVSFGTTTSISDEQINELAIGLEKSGQKFIWALREADKGDIFTGGGERARRRPVLPDGFEERVKGRGLVVREWAPQLEILGHRAIGGFMSHCGWNSCMESMSNGVPLIAWPMHSDQPANAVLVTRVLKIGLRVKDDDAGPTMENEVVRACVVEKVVRRLMASEEGGEIRKRARELGVAVRDCVKEGGVSSKEMDSFVSHITR